MINGHGDDFQGELIANFSSNVWYGADNAALYAHLHRQMPLTNRYPEADAVSLKNILAKREHIESSQIGIFNGSVEAIYHIAQAFAGSRSMIVAPTFSEYDDACRIYRHTVLHVSRNHLSEKIEIEKPDLLWLCNPNNPDGYCFDRRELLDLMDQFPQILFVIDQAYSDFSANDPIFAREIARYENLILIHSLTKRYSIPGLRLGFLICNEKTTAKIEKFRIPWSVNTLAIEAGKYILENNSSPFPIDQWLKAARNLQNEIDQNPVFETQPSQTPFFLIKLNKGKASELKTFLLNEKILVRDATNFEGLEGELIRINTLSHDENNLLLNKLNEWSQLITY